jgi:hypothetical protein
MRGTSNMDSESFTWRMDGNRVVMNFPTHVENYRIRHVGDNLTFFDGTIPGTFTYTRITSQALFNRLDDSSGRDVDSNNRGVASITFGSIFKHLGLEYAIGDRWVDEGNNWIRIPVSITNISNSDVSLLYTAIQIWSPNGLSILPQFTTVGEVGDFHAGTSLRPGAIFETFFRFQSQGDGTYEIELSEFLSQSNEVSVTITLPIMQTDIPSTSITAPHAGAGFIDLEFGLGRSPFYTHFRISIPSNWSYEIDRDDPGAVIIEGNVPGGRIRLSVEEMWGVDTLDDFIGNDPMYEFVFLDGYIGLYTYSFHLWGNAEATFNYWVRDDMWMRINFFCHSDFLVLRDEDFDMILNIARSLRRL